MEENKNANPAELSLTASTFEADGHVYHVNRTGKLSVIRDRYLERFSIASLLGRQAPAMANEMRRAYDFLIKGNVPDASVVLHNLINSAADITSRAQPLYYVCTLFINEEGEDTEGYSLELADKKISHWQKLPAFFFKQLALSYLVVTEQDWNETIQSYLLKLPNLDPLNEG